MSRLLRLFPVAALLVAAVPLSAAPRPDDRPGGPAVVGQARSLNDLLEMTKTLVRNVAGEKLYQEFEKEALPQLDPKQLPGIDARKPFGLYGTVDADLAKCRAVLLVPVTGDQAFLDMLNQFGIRTNPGREAGTFEIVIPPDVPFPVAGRFHAGYAYIAIGGADVLEPKVLLDPRDVIREREKAAAYLSLRLDRVPVATRRALLALAREQSEPLAEGIPEPELKAAFTAVRRLGLRWLTTLVEEGKEITLRLEADTKTGDVSLTTAVEGMAKSALSETIARRKPTANAFAGLAGTDPVQKVVLSAPLFAEEAQEALVKLIEFGERSYAQGPGAGGIPPEVNALMAAVFKSLKATVASGEMDLAAALRGPNKDGYYTAVGAVHCKESAQLEKAVREVVKALPGQASGYFQYDAHKVGALSVHQIDLSAEAERVAKAVFGDSGQKGYFAFGKGALYAAYGPDGLAYLKEAIEAKPMPAPVLDSWSNPKKTVELLKRMMPPGNPNGPRGALGLGLQESVAMAGMRVTVDGGDELTVRVRINVGGMFAGLFGFAGREVPVAPAPGAVAVPVAPPPPPLPVKKK